MGPRSAARTVVAFLLMPGASASGADLAEIAARGRIRVVTVQGGSPHFISTAPGAPPGFDREILDGFARLHRLEVELVPVSAWTDLIPALVSGQADVLAGQISDTEARRRFVDFTVEVFPTRNVVMTRKPHRVVSTIEELRAERVGTIKGTSLATLVAGLGLPPANVDDGLPSHQGVFAQALSAGRVTAVVNGVEGALKDMEKDPALQIGMFVGPPESLAYGVRKGDRQLLAALNEYIGNVRRTPTWNRLVVKYFGEAAVEILRKARAP